MNYTSPTITFLPDGTINIMIEKPSALHLLSMSIEEYCCAHLDITKDSWVHISIRKDGIFYIGSQTRVVDQYVLDEAQRIIGALADKMAWEDAA